jgi:hypothetical protein
VKVKSVYLLVLCGYVCFYTNIDFYGKISSCSWWLSVFIHSAIDFFQEEDIIGGEISVRNWL